jgi:hypothetical protein
MNSDKSRTFGDALTSAEPDGGVTLFPVTAGSLWLEGDSPLMVNPVRARNEWPVRRAQPVQRVAWYPHRL